VTALRIAIDAMGGDYGPSQTVPAVLDVLAENSHIHIVLVGDEPLLKKYLPPVYPPGLTVVHTSQIVLMNESPAVALRTKKDSSMRVAINLVKNQEAAACVSAGNTGALMAIAKLVLKTLPGIHRPAIVYSIPTDVGATDIGPTDIGSSAKVKRKNHPFGFVRMLDLGANIDCDAEQLVQFAVMGSVLASAAGTSDNLSRDNNKEPRVALLNIGSEAIKGPDSIKKAAAILSESKIVNYIGYVEGTGIFNNKADVIVCDGFVGNVALKCTEGVAAMLLRVVKREFQRSWYTKCLAALFILFFKSFLKRIDPSGYNGASLLGLRGTVIKSHGNAKRAAFKQAILEAIIQAQENVPQRIQAKIASKLESLDESGHTSL